MSTSFSLRPSINWLLAFIPISLALEYAHAPDPVLFFSAAIAIVPIARLIVLSTEQIATRTGDAIGGLLNATFGNAQPASRFFSAACASTPRNTTPELRGFTAR